MSWNFLFCLFISGLFLEIWTFLSRERFLYKTGNNIYIFKSICSKYTVALQVYFSLSHGLFKEE